MRSLPSNRSRTSRTTRLLHPEAACCKGVDVDARFGELRYHFFAVATVCRQQLTQLGMVGEGLQRPFGHGVHRERRGEALDIKNVGGLWILSSGTGP